MALSLAVREGERVFIGDRPILLETVVNAHLVYVVDDKGHAYKIDSNEQLEIYPDVWLQVGEASKHNGVNLTFAAPRSIVILREELYQHA